jgi:hypothetical protein
MMELRFLAANAEMQVGDVLVTSGLDGVYLPGLPVAKVVKIDRDSSYSFARITCAPLAASNATAWRWCWARARRCRRNPTTHPHADQPTRGKASRRSKRVKNKGRSPFSAI